MSRKKIIGISGIRSDYDLMSVLYRRLANDLEIDFQLLVGGAHLSKTYGYSIDLIKQDKIPILAEIESLIDADSLSARLKTASVMLQSTVDVVARWRPDLIVYAGDREEVWIGALLGNYLQIPTLHFYGGDHTSSWHPDNPVRHAASKLTSVHAVAHEEHRLRLLALGEMDARIHIVGNLSLDNFVAQEPIDERQLYPALGVPADIGDYAMVLFHPDPAEMPIAGDICRNILMELVDARIGACVGFPNTDPRNRAIIDAINEFRSHPRFFFYRNLGRAEYISLYKGARFIIGNSSSGILESASVPIPAINVGVRQRGRFAGANVLFIDTDRAAIARAIRQAVDPSFLAAIAGMKNSYGDGHAGERAYRLVKDTDFAPLRFKSEDPLQLHAVDLLIGMGRPPS